MEAKPSVDPTRRSAVVCAVDDDALLGTVNRAIGRLVTWLGEDAVDEGSAPPRLGRLASDAAPSLVAILLFVTLWLLPG